MYKVKFGRIIFNQRSIENSSEDERNTFIKRMRGEIVSFFKIHKYTLQINVTGKINDEYPCFIYSYRPESDFLFEKCKLDTGGCNYINWFWPNGSSGIFWLKNIPESDSI